MTYEEKSFVHIVYFDFYLLVKVIFRIVLNASSKEWRFFFVFHMFSFITENNYLCNGLKSIQHV